MAPSESSYDPIVSVEGMYKGSLTRLGYFFKDPEHYGKATLAVLRETAKRYDDALDDCLIQILEAKSLLENELAANRARRAREAAKIEVASSKRKLELETRTSTADARIKQAEENPAKRIKTEQVPGEAVAAPGKAGEEVFQQAPATEQRPVVNNRNAGRSSPLPMKESIQSDNDSIRRDAPQAASAKGLDTQSVIMVPQHNPGPEKKGESKEQTMIERGLPDQIASQDDLNFESMFADPEKHTDAGQDNANLDFGLTTLGSANLVGSSLYAFEPTAAQDTANNLELLPGLASYANASGDDLNMLSLPPTSAVEPAMETTKAATATVAAQPSVLVPQDSLDLPLPGHVPGDDTFNDLLGGDGYGGESSLVDLAFEDGFFDM